MWINVEYDVKSADLKFLDPERKLVVIIDLSDQSFYIGLWDDSDSGNFEKVSGVNFTPALKDLTLWDQALIEMKRSPRWSFLAGQMADR